MFNLNIQPNSQSMPEDIPQVAPLSVSEESEEILCDKGCPASGFQLVSVCVPVTVKPFAEIKRTKVKCIGEPMVTPGKDKCCGHHEECCSFTISQRICVEVPVVFGAKAYVGDTKVDCECTSARDICKKYDDYKEET